MKVVQKNNIDEYINLFFEKISNYNTEVFTELHQIYSIDKIGKICRDKKIKLIYGICLDLLGYVFTDFD